MKTSTPTPVLAALCCLVAGLVTTAAGLAAPTPEEAKTPPAEATRHASGLVTQVLEPGSGDRKPTGPDIVVVHFTGWDRAGKQFLSSREAERPQPFTSQMERIFPGWREALGMMVVGELRRVWVPDHLGMGNPRGPKSAVFDLELVEIRDLPEPPASIAAPAEATRLPSGGRFQVIHEGTSDERPAAGGSVLVHWTLWTDDGNIVDSTTLRGRPTAFLLDHVFFGFAELLIDMTVGEERFAWFPAAVHGGQWPGAPRDKGLVFRLEIERVLPDSLFTPQR